VKSNVEESTWRETPDPQTRSFWGKTWERFVTATGYNRWRVPRKQEVLLDVPDTPILIAQPVTVMNSSEHIPQSGDIPGSPSAEAGPHGLLLSRDLIFTTKINATAAELGYQIQVAGDAKLAGSLIAERRPRVVFIDLTAEDLCAPSALRVYRELAGPEAWFIAFGPHVDAAALAAAKAAGCQIAIPRSKFASELPELIRQYFSRLPY
jgi:hypothetical protein